MSGAANYSHLSNNLADSPQQTYVEYTAQFKKFKAAIDDKTSSYRQQLQLENSQLKEKIKSQEADNKAKILMFYTAEIAFHLERIFIKRTFGFQKPSKRIEDLRDLLLNPPLSSLDIRFNYYQNWLNLKQTKSVSHLFHSFTDDEELLNYLRDFEEERNKIRHETDDNTTVDDLKKIQKEFWDQHEEEEELPQDYYKSFGIIGDQLCELLSQLSVNKKYPFKIPVKNKNVPYFDHRKNKN